MTFLNTIHGCYLSEIIPKLIQWPTSFVELGAPTITSKSRNSRWVYIKIIMVPLGKVLGSQTPLNEPQSFPSLKVGFSIRPNFNNATSLFIPWTQTLPYHEVLGSKNLLSTNRIDRFLKLLWSWTPVPLKPFLALLFFLCSTAAHPVVLPVASSKRSRRPQDRCHFRGKNRLQVGSFSSLSLLIRLTPAPTSLKGWNVQAPNSVRYFLSNTGGGILCFILSLEYIKATTTPDMVLPHTVLLLPQQSIYWCRPNIQVLYELQF